MLATQPGSRGQLHGSRRLAALQGCQHLESCYPASGQDRVKQYVPVRPGTYLYKMVKVSTGFPLPLSVYWGGTSRCILVQTFSVPVQGCTSQYRIQVWVLALVHRQDSHGTWWYKSVQDFSIPSSRTRRHYCRFNSPRSPKGAQEIEKIMLLIGKTIENKWYKTQIITRYFLLFHLK